LLRIHRNRFEIYRDMLNKARKGALKWHLLLGDERYGESEETLQTLVEAGLLEIDESKMKICKNGQRRNMVYQTTKKGKDYLQELEELQKLLS